MSQQLPTQTQAQPDRASICNILGENAPVLELTNSSTATCAVQHLQNNDANDASDASSAPVDVASTPQEAPEVPLPPLTQVQLQALKLLNSGMRIGEVAKKLDVDRTTLFRWKSRHPAFIAAINNDQKDIHDCLSARIANTLNDAVKFLSREMSRRYSDDRMRAALAIVSAFGTKRLLSPAGPTSEKQILLNLATQSRAEAGRPLDPPFSHDELRNLAIKLSVDSAPPQQQSEQ